MNKIKDYDSRCGDCPLIDWCGEPYELPYLCNDSRFENMTADEYISIAETVNVDEEVEGTSAYKEVVSDKVHEIVNNADKMKIEKELDYWKREAIKNAAELGEIKIKQTPMKPKKEEAVFRYIDTYTCPACNKSFSGALVNYCYRCGQAIDWSV